MDEHKVPSEEKDAAAPGEPGQDFWGPVLVSPAVVTPPLPTADGVMASEEMGSAEGDPLKPPEGASVGPEPESTGMEAPPEAGR